MPSSDPPTPALRLNEPRHHRHHRAPGTGRLEERGDLTSTGSTHHCSTRACPTPIAHTPQPAHSRLVVGARTPAAPARSSPPNQRACSVEPDAPHLGSPHRHHEHAAAPGRVVAHARETATTPRAQPRRSPPPSHSSHHTGDADTNHARKAASAHSTTSNDASTHTPGSPAR
jgi:hypothetical protein